MQIRVITHAHTHAHTQSLKYVCVYFTHTECVRISIYVCVCVHVLRLCVCAYSWAFCACIYLCVCVRVCIDMQIHSTKKRDIIHWIIHIAPPSNIQQPECPIHGAQVQHNTLRHKKMQQTATRCNTLHRTATHLKTRYQVHRHFKIDLCFIKHACQCSTFSFPKKRALVLNGIYAIYTGLSKMTYAHAYTLTHIRTVSLLCTISVYIY